MLLQVERCIPNEKLVSVHSKAIPFVSIRVDIVNVLVIQVSIMMYTLHEELLYYVWIISLNFINVKFKLELL